MSGSRLTQPGSSARYPIVGSETTGRDDDAPPLVALPSDNKSAARSREQPRQECSDAHLRLPGLEEVRREARRQPHARFDLAALPDIVCGYEHLKLTNVSATTRTSRRCERARPRLGPATAIATTDGVDATPGA